MTMLTEPQDKDVSPMDLYQQKIERMRDHTPEEFVQSAQALIDWALQETAGGNGLSADRIERALKNVMHLGWQAEYLFSRSLYGPPGERTEWNNAYRTLTSKANELISQLALRFRGYSP